MLNYKPISVDRARVEYFRTIKAVKSAENGIERDRARTSQRRATQVLQNAQRIERNRKQSIERAKKRRRIDWNVAVY